jgi:O-antigen ligase
MQWNTLKALLMFGLAAFVAICFGFSVALGDYRLIFLAAAISILIALIVYPGYAPLLALGILCPFSPPMPFVWQLPFTGVVLGICCLKFFVERAISTKPSPSINTMNAPAILFFGWVFIRYCMKPMLPNMMGWGQNVTGFRAYLNYGIAFVIVFALGRFLPRRDDLSKLFKWMTICSLVFVVVLVALMPTKNMFFAVFVYIGLFATAFDNGMLRFVILPAFGIVLISVSMLPLLYPTTKLRRRLLLIVGWTAVILGGGRAGLLMALAVAFGILFLNRQWLRLSLIVGTLGFLAVIFSYAGDRLAATNIGFLRPLSLISARIAENSDADANWEFRRIRWERAVEEIRKNPIAGESYGGVENAWVAEQGGASEETAMEMTLATGSVHNGFLDCALALGIPAALFFTYILVSRIIITGRRAMALRKSDPLMSQVNCFLSTNLVALALTISIGTDVNDKQIWLYLGLTVLAERLAGRATKAAIPMAKHRWEPVRV